VVPFPAGTAPWPGADAGDLVRAAWSPGTAVVIADLTSVVQWEAADLEGLRRAHRDLVVRGGELRIVVWSADLYAALQVSGISSEISIFASIDAAKRAR
jgi:hypothetical protein